MSRSRSRLELAAERVLRSVTPVVEGQYVRYSRTPPEVPVDGQSVVEVDEARGALMELRRALEGKT